MGGFREYIVVGGQGRSGADVLASAYVSYGAAILAALLLGLLIAGNPSSRETAEPSVRTYAGGSLSFATTGERVPVPGRATTRRGGGELLESE